MMKTIAFLAVGAGVALACDKPDGSPAGYGCATSRHEFDSGPATMQDWAKNYQDWIGTPPAVMTQDNAWVQNGELGIAIKQKKNPNGVALPDWVSPQFADSVPQQCACGYKALTSGLLASKEKFKEGFYEASIKTVQGEQDPFLTAFWLQGDSAEINIIEYVNNMRGDGGKSSYWTDVHCFDSADTTGTKTVSQHQKITFGNDANDFDVPTPFVKGGFHTYGVSWEGKMLNFYLDGKLIRKDVEADCLLGAATDGMNVIFSRETRPEFDGEEAGENKLSIPVTKDYAVKVKYFRFWEKTAGAATTDSTGAATTDSTTPSAVSCDSLGWNAVNNVCAARKINGDCGHTDALTTFAEAEQRCESVGARLCTIDELKLLGATTEFQAFLKSGDAGCASWKAGTKLWTSDKGTCTGDDENTANIYGKVQCEAKSAAKSNGQCCLTNPVKKFCEDADEPSLYGASSTINGEEVCARVNFGYTQTSKSQKKCKYLSYDEAAEFCVAEGGDLCTLDMLQGDAREGTGVAGSGTKKGTMYIGGMGNGVTKSEPDAFGQKATADLGWKKQTDKLGTDCGKDTSYIWIKDTTTWGEATPFKSTANMPSAAEADDTGGCNPKNSCGGFGTVYSTKTSEKTEHKNPTDLHCNGVKAGHQAAGINNKDWSASQKRMGYYRPVTKRMGYLRKDFKGNKIVKSHRCNWKGSPTNAKSRKLTVCCFKKK